MRCRVFVTLAAFSCLLAACSLAPDYSPPKVDVPRTYKESAMWTEGAPGDDRPRGEWWRSFNDRALDELEPQVETANPDVAAAVAAMDRARAFTAKAEAGLFPLVQFNGALSSNKQSAHRPLRKANTPDSAQGLAESILSNRPFNEPDHYGNNSLQLQSSYEIDLWGRVRNAVAVGRAEAEASAADLYSVQLGLQAELARDYIALRGVDAERRLLMHTATVYKEALALTKARLVGQIASPADVPRAEAQLETVMARLADLSARRALVEHAIATLIGKPASTFSIPLAERPLALPHIPTGLPSTLLQRRPDVAAAERRLAAANESIGIARAAFFPRVSINIAGGTQDTGLSLLSLKNSVWSVGPAVTLPIFDGGAKLADLGGAEAAYAETVAHYRGSVLRAIQDVEDELAALRWLKAEARNVGAAAGSTQKVLDVSLQLYRDGAVTYLDVVSAQTAALDAQRTALDLETRRLQASLALMMALGGGWSSAALASAR